MSFRIAKKHVVPTAIGLGILGGAVFLIMGQSAGPANCYMITMPPVQYDYKPTRPFKRLNVVHLVVDSTCRHYADFSYMNARLQSCVITNGDNAMMIIPSDLDSIYTACLVRHENGHLNGWGYDHRGARYYPIPPPSRDQVSRTGSFGF